MASRVGAAAAPLAMMLLLTLRGTPTLYYGDELGLPDADVPPPLMRDPQARVGPALSRDPARSPMPWAPGWAGLEAGADVLAYHRRAGDDERLVGLNFAPEARTLPVPGRWIVEVSTHASVSGGAALADSPVLDAHQGAVLRPA